MEMRWEIPGLRAIFFILRFSFSYLFLLVPSGLIFVRCYSPVSLFLLFTRSLFSFLLFPLLG